MNNQNVLKYLQNVIAHLPQDWVKLTTHRLDIYDESRAKSEFIEEFDRLFTQNIFDTQALSELPTAYDYIRLGHPLSTILEWAISKEFKIPTASVISFSSQTMPILAVLRTNLLKKKATRIVHTDQLPESLDTELLKKVYGYDFTVEKVESTAELPAFDGSTILVSEESIFDHTNVDPTVGFQLHTVGDLGSVLITHGDHNVAYVSDIQHVRRRETIAMTPADTLTALKMITGETDASSISKKAQDHKKTVLQEINQITNTSTKPLVASSGLSIQYAIMMGLIHYALEHHKGKAIKFVVPPNCYGGTNDQARRVAATHDLVSIVDLPVDGDNDMVQSVESVLAHIAQQDAVPYIIAEIPTNPRVEVPDLQALEKALSKPRKTPQGTPAIAPVFILDQTFCPNYHFLGNEDILATVNAISYASGSKFPSGGKVTAGYCVANDKASNVMTPIEQHLSLCDNEATALQYEILAQQLPSMNARIEAAYKNTREFVTFINEVLPEAKINFVSEDLAKGGFTPSVFSLDLPSKGATPEEKEAHKRKRNHQLITMMITQIPDESKYCVSYGQLKGVYWTIPATSTQGTTKEGDKDYIVRASLSGTMDLEKHKEVFREFVKTMH